jgi:hypothetical protein
MPVFDSQDYEDKKRSDTHEASPRKIVNFPPQVFFIYASHSEISKLDFEEVKFREILKVPSSTQQHSTSVPQVDSQTVYFSAMDMASRAYGVAKIPSKILLKKLGFQAQKQKLSADSHEILQETSFSSSDTSSRTEQPFKIYKIINNPTYNNGVFISFEKREVLGGLVPISSFIIPDIDALYAFFRILKKSGIEPHLGERLVHKDSSRVVQICLVHYVAVLEKIYGGSSKLIGIGGDAKSIQSADNKFLHDQFNYKFSENYAQHLLKIVQLLNINASIIQSFENSKMQQLAMDFFNPPQRLNRIKVERYKKILENMITRQFDAKSFCSYATTVVDYGRCFFDKIIIRNLDVLKLPLPSRIPEGGMQGLATRMRHLVTTLSPPLPFLTGANFIPAFLMLSINQGSIASYAHAFMGAINCFCGSIGSQSISFSNNLTVLEVEKSAQRVQMKLSIESRAIGNELIHVHAFFTYIFDLNSRVISLENPDIFFSPLLEQWVCDFDKDIFQNQDLFNKQSDIDAWGRITNIAHLISKDKLDVDMIKFMSEQVPLGRESTC